MRRNLGTNVVRFSEVVSIYDPAMGGRIKVRLLPEDAKYMTIDELPYCTPMVPKHFHIVPKVGECVMVILANPNSTESERLYFGPLISQPYALGYDSCIHSKSILRGGSVAMTLPNPENNPENTGTYPEQFDVALRGRENTDLFLKANEIRMLCGHKKNPFGALPDTLLFNREDLAYIQMKYLKRRDHNDQEYRSNINIVADRINLLSHDSKNKFKLNDPKYLIDDEDMKKIYEQAHPLVYGDELVDFLKRLIEVIRTHTHPFPMKPPSFTTPQNDVLGENLDAMLSQSVRTN